MGYLLLSIATGIGIPRQVAALSAGALYGVSAGFAIAYIATITGCMLTFLVSRYLLANWLFNRFSDKANTVHQFLADSTFTKALIIRILPLGSNFVTNILAGATKIPFIPYVSGSALGFIPQMLIFTLTGAGLQLAAEQQQQVTIGLVLLALALGVMLYLSRKQRGKLKTG